MPSYCKRCKKRVAQAGICDDCTWAGMVERRIGKMKDNDPKLKSESDYAKEFWANNMKRYKKSRYGLGFL